MEITSPNYCIISSFQTDAEKYLGSSKSAKYILSYLGKLDAATFLVEDTYIDKDFIIDYSRFYSRSFEANCKFTDRVHFFSLSFSKDEFLNALLVNDKNFFEQLQESYLGFSIVKPIFDEMGEPIIGRSLLKTFPDSIDGETRVYLKHPYSISLFGIPLEINSLPFQTQDQAVGACATVACWISIFPLSELFDTPKLSPYEVTEKSITFPVFNNRNFPSFGLSALQIKNFYNMIGIDTEYIPLFNATGKPNGYLNEMLKDALMAYIPVGLPILATLQLFHPIRGNDFHAVIVSGFRHRNGELKEIYVHDDQIGPFSKVELTDDYTDWINEWTKDFGYTKVKLVGFTIPIYPKIRLPFSKMIEYKKAYVAQLTKKKATSPIYADASISLRFSEVRRYKEYLLGMNILKKIEMLRKPFPRFIWIIRLESNNKPLTDWVFDGTSVYANIISTPEPSAEPFETIVYSS